jgi:hypothetical protein
MKRIFITFMVIIAIFTYSPAFAETLTIALFDLSGSVLTDNTGNDSKESPYSRNMAELKYEINKLKRADMIIVIGFGRKSNVTLLKASMPKQAGPMNRNLIATREVAVRKLDENIASKVKLVDSSKTDIIGSLFRASRLISEATLPESTERKLLIYSDMLDNENIGLSFNKLKNNKVSLQSKAGVPDLRGVEVNIYSAFSDIKGMSTVQTEAAIKNLKAFWTDYFLKSGSVVKLYRTSY